MIRLGRGKGPVKLLPGKIICEKTGLQVIFAFCDQCKKKEP